MDFTCAMVCKRTYGTVTLCATVDQGRSAPRRLYSIKLSEMLHRRRRGKVPLSAVSMCNNISPENLASMCVCRYPVLHG